MHQVRLLERLSILEDPARAAGIPYDRLLCDSIIRYLEQLLNTRAGSVPVDPDYGLADMSNIAGSFALGTAEALAEAIIRQIRRYEPRLKNPQISVGRETREVITLRFELRGHMATGRDDSPDQLVIFIIRINAAGRVFVEPESGR